MVSGDLLTWTLITLPLFLGFTTAFNAAAPGTDGVCPPKPALTSRASLAACGG